MTNERIDWRFLGRIIGTVTGWDGEMECFNLYDFVPADGIALPSGDMQVDVTEGKFKYYTNEGEERQSFDILDILK